MLNYTILMAHGSAARDDRRRSEGGVDEDLAARASGAHADHASAPNDVRGAGEQRDGVVVGEGDFLPDPRLRRADGVDLDDSEVTSGDTADGARESAVGDATAVVDVLFRDAPELQADCVGHRHEIAGGVDRDCDAGVDLRGASYWDGRTRLRDLTNVIAIGGGCTH